MLEAVVAFTVNGTPLPATSTLSLHDALPISPTGTGATMEVPLQLFGVAAVPLNMTLLVPCVEPKLKPLMDTNVPTTPEVGDRLAIAGAGVALTVAVAVAVLPSANVAANVNTV